MWLATVMATVKPAYMASPPRRGTGVTCTSRERTGDSALATSAMWRTTGTDR